MNSRFFWPLALIALGVLFLLDNLGWLPGNAWGYIWPLLLILMGLSLLLAWRTRPEPVEESVSLEGAQSAAIRLNHGAGELAVRGGVEAGLLYAGTFHGGVDKRVDRHGGRAEVRLSANASGLAFWPGPWAGRSQDWDLRLTDDIPLDLELDSGASRTRLDLTSLRVTNLRVKTGASDTDIRLPERAGRMRARIEAGAAAVTVHVPPGVAARITGGMGLGAVSVDTRRFPSRGGLHESPDFASAEHSVEIDIQGGVGSVSVI
jgi:hypothetical protein